MRRFCICVIYDNQNIYEKYVDVLLHSIKGIAEKLVIVCNSPDMYIDTNLYIDEIVYRRNEGFDAKAIAETIIRYEEKIKLYDELIVLNDTFYGPFFPIQDMFVDMETETCDYWGITRHPGGKCGNKDIEEHIQSYFLVFKKKILADNRFIEFWHNMPTRKSVNDVILDYELGINRLLKEQGYIGASYMDYRGFDISLQKNDNPYLLYPYALIAQYRIPFLKRRSLDFDNEGYTDALNALVYIRDNCEYDINNILNHINRLSTLGTQNNRYNYIKLIEFIEKHKSIYLYGNGKWASHMDAFFSLLKFPIPLHVVSVMDPNNRNAISFADLQVNPNDGIIIAISNPECVWTVCERCLEKFDKKDIFYPRCDSNKLR